MLVPVKNCNGRLCNIIGISPSVGEVGVVVHDVLFDRMVRLREVLPEKRVPPRLHERVPCKIKGKMYFHFLNGLINSTVQRHFHLVRNWFSRLKHAENSRRELALPVPFGKELLYFRIAAGPGFPRRGKKDVKIKGVPTYYLANIRRKLHGNEKNWTGGTLASKILLCKSATLERLFSPRWLFKLSQQHWSQWCMSMCETYWKSR